MTLFRPAPVLLIVLLAAHCCHAHGLGFDEAELTTFIASQQRITRVPGLAVGIVRDDGVVYLRGFGAPAGRAITARTPFLIGSLSKSFTALAVMQLVEAGKVELDAPVRRYLPWFRLKDLGASEAITVRHLLNQTSGLPTSAGFFTPDAGSLAGTALAHPVGQVYEYCNLNYRLLGLLIEAVTGQTYAAYVREHILAPLEMRNTFLTYEEAAARGLTGGHQYAFGLPLSVPTRRYDGGSVAAGYIASTAEDMCHYLVAQLRGGVYGGRRVITPESIALMRRPPDGVGSRYGMGWLSGERDGIKSVWHTGLTEDFSANMSVMPEQGYGVIILADVNSFTLHRDMMDGIVRRLHGRPTKTYVPYELLQRLLLLAALLFGLTQLAVRLWKWYGLGCPLVISVTAKAGARLALGVAASGILVIAVPLLADAPLHALLAYQPDIGYGVVCGAVTFTLAGVVGALVGSKAPRAPVE
jgi:CubicO group peptidase (beta-lactamase class C family)